MGGAGWRGQLVKREKRGVGKDIEEVEAEEAREGVGRMRF